jgi:phage terminase large subunit-like protein
MDWSTSCKDWKSRIVAGQSLIPPPLFPDEAEDALKVFRELRMVDVAGSPTFGELSRPWVTDFASAVFGAYEHNPEGRRHITEFFMLISKKNGKSTIAAAIMMTALIRNWRKSAEFLILAPTVEIANNSFYPARDMVRADEELTAIMQVQDHVRTITNRITGATLKVVAAEAETVGGKKATGILIDELWQFGKKPNAENMLREATGGLASRPEGFVIYLSTQSDEAPAGVFKSKLQYARKVRDGVIVDKRFMPVIYEFPAEIVEAKEHLDPANFYITNPNIDASVDREFLTRELGKAEEAGDDSLRGFLSKHLNVEIDIALSSDRWVGAEYWLMNATPGLTFAALLERSEIIDMGIDGGGLEDLLGIAAVGRDKDSGEWLHWAHAWAHPSVFERHKAIAARLRDFVKDGDLTIVVAKNQDVTEVAEYAAKVDAAGLLDMIGVDQHGLGGILDALEDAGIPKEKIIGISQGWKMVGAIKTTERRLFDGALKHGGQPLMTWCVGNAKVVPHGNAISIEKEASGKGKIDPLMATFNAVSLMGLNPVPKVPQLFI